MAHVIVCGLGQLGFRVTSLLLRMGELVTVVTQDTRQEFLDLATQAGATIVTGDARSDHVLLSAGLERAKALITCIDDDVVNIEVALDARRLNPELRVVARLFDQTLARRLEETLGIHRAIAMSVLAAPTFASSALGETVFGTLSWRGAQMVAVRSDSGAEELVTFQEFAKRTASDTGPARRRFRERSRAFWVGVRSAWTNIPGLLKTVFAVILLISLVSIFVFQFGMGLSGVDAVYFVVTTLTTTGYGDISLKTEPLWLKLYGCLLMLLGSASVAALYSLVTDFVVSARFDQVLGKRSVRLAGHVVVAGLGNVGFRIVESLVRMGVPVAVVELEPEANFRQFLNKSVPFTAGDARDTEVLERAGVRSARAVIVATQNDAVNLSVGLAARAINSGTRIVVRLFDAEFAQKVEQVLSVDAALSASRIAAPGFVGAALYQDPLLCYVDGDRFCRVVETEGGLSVQVQPIAKV